MKALIFARSTNNVIGLDGGIPWRYPGDFKRFKRVTMGGALIMGRKTWASIGKPLPGRDNIVVSTSAAALGVSYRETQGCMPETLYFVESIDKALKIASVGRRDTWFIGGRSIYEAAMGLVDVIDETEVPDVVSVEGHVSFAMSPEIPADDFECSAWMTHEDDARLRRRVWLRRGVEQPYDLADNRRLQELGYLTR